MCTFADSDVALVPVNWRGNERNCVCLCCVRSEREKMCETKEKEKESDGAQQTKSPSPNPQPTMWGAKARKVHVARFKKLLADVLGDVDVQALTDTARSVAETLAEVISDDLSAEVKDAKLEKLATYVAAVAAENPKMWDVVHDVVVGDKAEKREASEVRSRPKRQAAIKAIDNIRQMTKNDENPPEAQKEAPVDQTRQQKEQQQKEAVVDQTRQQKKQESESESSNENNSSRSEEEPSASSQRTLNSAFRKPSDLQDVEKWEKALQSGATPADLEQELFRQFIDTIPAKAGAFTKQNAIVIVESMVNIAAGRQIDGLQRMMDQLMRTKIFCEEGAEAADTKQALKEARKKSRHKKQTDTHRSFSHGRKPRSILTLEPDQYHRLNSTEKKSLQALRDKASGKTKE